MTSMHKLLVRLGVHRELVEYGKNMAISEFRLMRERS